jgi:hypothetical protein
MVLETSGVAVVADGLGTGVSLGVGLTDGWRGEGDRVEDFEVTTEVGAEAKMTDPSKPARAHPPTPASSARTILRFRARCTDANGSVLMRVV